MNSKKYSIVMFAYNEEKKIAASIESIFDNVDDNLCKLFVMANGCTDNTVTIVNELKQQFEKLEVINLSIGDKCNAWNEYVHNIAPECDAHFFVDADVEFTDKVFPQLFNKLTSTVQAHAIAGLPFSGRNKSFYRSLVIERGCLFGNCYGLKQEFIDSIRQTHFKLPKGLCWIDSAITKAVNGDLKYQDTNIPGRVTYNKACGYKFKSLNPFKKDDRNLYFSRIARYATGKLQEKYLEKLDFKDWPLDLNEINQNILNAVNHGKVKLPFYLRNRIVNRLQKTL
jgi:glycosyltransferase involved in cell wall biosynthesis